MLIVYYSVTGNVKSFVNKLDVKSHEINPTNPLVEVDEDYVIITPTYDKEVTEPINEFIEFGDNLKHLKGVVGSGNVNFDDLYIFTAKDLSKKYNVPLLFDFEYFGTDSDILSFKEVLNTIAIT